MSQAGPLAEEATRLLGAVEDWWRERADAGAPRTECTACPLCQLLAAVRTARPEAFEHAADAAGSLVLALRSLLDAHDRAWTVGHRRPVQHIPVREGDE
ncbi:MAG TPA: hypothetical protein VEZ46_14810 [Mycobacteriales bacterium]|nr:hypothetical protein [Mycobacteriales bacterium]